ncbi:reverse transcriptase zinc-binding domain-containing protein [Artemisia annua]|uniref:Reverse transcriptase zinc-binding domain-containing protein n=1 Tax=Artemisia annua TaxID=35608 RepID=A0A2U1NSR9_ARTAN|nr:reverse transcriptase zinc-binding domain-containing protein [Artemisia annua]
MDSHSHLFFDCQFSKFLWGKLKIMAKLDNVSDVWAEVISAVCVRNASNSIWSIVQRLVFGAVVYFIWQERNIRLFEGKDRSMNTIFKQITNIVRLRLLSLNIKWSSEVCKVAEIWDLPGLGRKGAMGVTDDMDIDDIT